VTVSMEIILKTFDEQYSTPNLLLYSSN